MECIQPVAPDLIAISHFTGRNLLDSFFQHRHHHFVIDQECLPGGENRRQKWNVKKIFLFFKCVFILCVCALANSDPEVTYDNQPCLPVESGPRHRVVIVGGIDQLRDSLSSYFLHRLQDVIHIF